jgi:hypothetical protein
VDKENLTTLAYDGNNTLVNSTELWDGDYDGNYEESTVCTPTLVDNITPVGNRRGITTPITAPLQLVWQELDGVFYNF